MDAVTTLINNMGFPIAMCLILCYYIREMGINHRKEVDGLSEIIKENTELLKKIANRLAINTENETKRTDYREDE